VGRGAFRPQFEDFAQVGLGGAEPLSTVVRPPGRGKGQIDPGAQDQRVDIVRIEIQGAVEVGTRPVKVEGPGGSAFVEMAEPEEIVIHRIRVRGALGAPCLGALEFLPEPVRETRNDLVLHVLEALRISPRDTDAGHWMMTAAYAKLGTGLDEEAIAWLNRSIEIYPSGPTPHFLLAAALARLGSLLEAREAVRVGLELNPGFTIARYWSFAPSDNPVYLAGRERIYEGLRMAGVPEE